MICEGRKQIEISKIWEEKRGVKESEIQSSIKTQVVIGPQSHGSTYMHNK